MKQLFLLAALVVGATANAEIITRWDFENTSPVSNLLLPTMGTGTLTTIGGVTYTSAQGAGVSPAPVGTAINLASFPTQGSGAITSGRAGINAAVSTNGYTGLTISWNERHSNTAAKTTGFFYSVDGTNYVQFATFVTATATTWAVHSVDLSAVSGVNNNPNFNFKIVSLADSGANYTGTAGTYGTTGTIRIDNLAVKGLPVPEPASMAVVGVGLAALRRRRAKK